MPNEKPPIHPPVTSPKYDTADAAELAKLTKEFIAALTRLLPAAERASKRGKHSLLRLISRKLPRLKPPTDDATEDEEDDDTRIIFDLDKPITRERCLANAAAELENGNQDLADYWTTNAPKFKPEAEGGGPTPQEEARLAADDEAFHQRNAPDTMRKPAKTQAKTLVSENDRSELRTTRSDIGTGSPTSGAPRSQNEEPWPGQANFPRPKRGLMRRR
jgi:hypothetical protein